MTAPSLPDFATATVKPSSPLPRMRPVRSRTVVIEQEDVMNARLTFTRRNTLLGAATLAAWSLWACAAMTASAILTQSNGRVATDPLLSLSGGLYEVTSRLELPHV